MYSGFQKNIKALWAKPQWMLWPLLPFSWLFSLGVFIRRRWYQSGFFAQKHFQVPVVIMGNLHVGGSGKTPLLIHIAQMLKKQGLKIGVISRGYKGSHQKPTLVNAQSDPALVGDEPCLIYQHLQCPVVVEKKRVEALNYLLANHSVDLVLSGDGLQHYALARDIEIVVMPVVKVGIEIGSVKSNMISNTYCLPAGPLREPLSRLKEVDLIVYNAAQIPSNNGIDKPAYCMQYIPDLLYNAMDLTKKQPLELFKGMKVHAIAGLGKPTPFFSMLQTVGLNIIPHIYPDHHAYRSNDILFADSLPVIMTEKDFVKCKNFVKTQHWVLPIQVVLSEGFDQALWNLIQAKIKKG